ncbi:MAG: lysostaphin resistance A-like protein, partial [Promethearchaeota archaeon]
MTIDENNDKFLTFLTPALLSFSAALLLTVLQVFISIFLVGILMRLPDFGNPLYEPVWNLILLFLSQILSSLIIVFWLIPWLKLRDERQSPLNWNTFFSTLLLICLTWVLIIIKTILIVIPIESLQLEPPRTGLEALIISEEILSPVTIIILFAPLVIGAPLFEELVYRRILIPLLEQRGMPSIGALIASSLFFTFLHVPSDLLNGNITGTVLHISSVIILGFVLGISYIKTRNVI